MFKVMYPLCPNSSSHAISYIGIPQVLYPCCPIPSYDLLPTQVFIKQYTLTEHTLPGILFEPRAPSWPISWIGFGDFVVVGDVVVVDVVVVVVVGTVVVGFAHSAEIGLLRILLQEMKRCEPSVAQTTSNALMVISLKATDTSFVFSTMIDRGETRRNIESCKCKKIILVIRPLASGYNYSKQHLLYCIITSVIYRQLS